MSDFEITRERMALLYKLAVFLDTNLEEGRKISEMLFELKASIMAEGDNLLLGLPKRSIGLLFGEVKDEDSELSSKARKLLLDELELYGKIDDEQKKFFEKEMSNYRRELRIAEGQKKKALVKKDKKVEIAKSLAGEIQTIAAKAIAIKERNERIDIIVEEVALAAAVDTVSFKKKVKQHKESSAKYKDVIEQLKNSAFAGGLRKVKASSMPKAPMDAVIAFKENLKSDAFNPSQLLSSFMIASSAAAALLSDKQSEQSEFNEIVVINKELSRIMCQEHKEISAFYGALERMMQLASEGREQKEINVAAADLADKFYKLPKEFDGAQILFNEALSSVGVVKELTLQKSFKAAQQVVRQGEAKKSFVEKLNNKGVNSSNFWQFIVECIAMVCLVMQHAPLINMLKTSIQVNASGLDEKSINSIFGQPLIGSSMLINCG
jgi:hypothetical protein